MSPGDAALNVAGASKAYGRNYALRDVSLTIARGEFVGLFGQNGAGKSTLLRICAALMRPTSGSVRVMGLDPWADVRARSNIGFLSHAVGLYPNLTVRENLEFFAGLSGVGERPVAQADRVIERLGLTPYAGAAVRALSRGWQQRAAIARGLLADPTVLLWDEPFTGLDERTVGMMAEVARQFRESGRTAFISSHDFGRTMSLCDRAVIIERGSVVFDGGGAEAERAYRAVMGLAKQGTSA